MLQFGLTLLFARVAFRFSEQIFSAIREDFVQAVTYMDHRELEKVPTGDILSRATTDMTAVQEIVRTGVPEVISGLLTTILTVVIAFIINPYLGLCSLLGLPFIIFFTRSYVSESPAAYAAELEASANVTTTTAETVRGAIIVETLGLESIRESKIHESVSEAKKQSLRTLRLEQRWIPGVQIGYHLPLLLTLVVGAFLVHLGKASIGEVTTVVLLMQAVLTPLDDLIYWFGEVQSAAAAFGRLLGVSATKQEPSGIEPRAHTGIDIQDLSFGFDTNNLVIEHLDLSIEAGDHVALVGASGAGKSTLAQLITGVLSPSSGNILIDGQKITSYGVNLPKVVSMVTQEDHIFGDSLRFNLLVANEDATDDDCLLALTSVGAVSWVLELPDGLDTLLGPDNFELSVLQSRQVALARLLLIRPHVFILDEVSAGIPSTVIKAFKDLLRMQLPDSIVIEIAHNLESATISDRILVLDHGTVVEDGSHEELIGVDGYYRKLIDDAASARRLKGNHASR
ncbi:hypothetical protein AOZ07_01520 [Glutamicibacter halophytocola]|nr:hypothetical protein AOZ07_01520 [Glutamicibacter halophytocola]